MALQANISRHNFYAFLWHAVFLALAQNFMDIDTVLPAMLIEAGGTGIHVGLMTAIMLGGARFTQLLFAPFISNFEYKRKFLLAGINGRILSLFIMGLMLFYAHLFRGHFMIWMIFILISIFSLGGAFASISYNDILGKSIQQSARKSFLSIKQVLTGIVLLTSALLARWMLTAADFPRNYAHMFFTGSVALLIASFGFWRLREHVPSRMPVRSMGQFRSLMMAELRRNQRLGYFLGWVNTMGISITLLPFVMLYAKEVFQAQSHETGTFLFYKVVGGVSVGMLLFALSRRFKYRYLLYSNVVVVLTILSILLFSDAMPPFKIIFLIGGIVFAAYSISMSGVLLEISGNENRALYTGIAGAGNVLPALFPMLSGWIIEQFGFQIFFILFMFMILSSLFFIYKLDCRS
jgi:MFS family permease